MEDYTAAETDIVVVGGGICGLAVALALQRKGLKSVVLERSDGVRVAVGTAIIVQPNGWYALEQLGVAAKLRQTSVLIDGGHHLFLDTGRRNKISFGDVDEGGMLPEVRCLKRKDLIESMAENLMPNTIQFNRHVTSMKLESFSSCPVLELTDGTKIKAKIVIGADGVNSVVSDYVGVSGIRAFRICAVRGCTYYEDGHRFGNEFLLLRKSSPHVQLGRMPMTDHLVYWFVTRFWSSQDPGIVNEAELIKQSTIQAVKSFPLEIRDMVKNSEPTSLHLARLKYRPPWKMIRWSFHKGTVAVAGDAMHAMGPFLAQGGSASLEDAIVLARCLSEVACFGRGGEFSPDLVERALSGYVKERKRRVVKLSTETYLVGKLMESSCLTKVLVVFVLAVCFRGNATHAKFRCGQL